MTDPAAPLGEIMNTLKIVQSKCGEGDWSMVAGMIATALARGEQKEGT